MAHLPGMLRCEWPQPWSWKMDNQNAPTNCTETAIILQRLLHLKEPAFTPLHPPWRKLFTCDITSMYTNIRTGPAIERNSPYLCLEHIKIFHHYNVNALIETIHMVFENNIIAFRDAYLETGIWHRHGDFPCPALGHNLLWTV